MGSTAHAVILFGLDNTANQTDPDGSGIGLPYESVGRLFNIGGTVGSGIYLGNGWMLTANHVGPYDSVTFDNVTNYAWDGNSPIQLGTSDMKLFRLASMPTVPAVLVYGGTGEQAAPSAMIGWGVGRNFTPINSDSVGWGDASTIAKRWGLNTPMDVQNISYDGYSYQAFLTVLGSTSGTPAGLGASEAAATLYDSGSGLFQQIGGTWYLIGLTTAVEAANTSVFGNDQTADPNGHFNYFARVRNYESTITSIIPEPSTALLAGLGALLFCRRRRARYFDQPFGPIRQKATTSAFTLPSTPM